MDRKMESAKTEKRSQALRGQFRQVGGIAANRLVTERESIRTSLNIAGITLAMIDREFGLADGTARNTLREPNLRGERAIAAVFNTYPHLIWPSRYRPNGQRRRPQDYSRVPTLEQRRNETGAMT